MGKSYDMMADSEADPEDLDGLEESEELTGEDLTEEEYLEKAQ